MLNGKALLLLPLMLIAGLCSCSLGATVPQVAAGECHTVALLSDGTVWAWGNNTYGQLGDGTFTSRSIPVQVPGLSGVTAIAAGSYHTVALLGDGTVRAWGYNGDGELGDATTTTRNAPVSVSGLSGATAIAAGFYHTVARKTDGTVRAWGSNDYGQLGDASHSNRTTSVAVSGLSGVTAVAAGGYKSVALMSDNTVRAWGYNNYGQLGDGTTADRSTPVTVSGISGVMAIAAGDKHTVALKSDNTVWAWGYNGDGELGDGSGANSSTPVQVSGLSGVTAIAAGYDHTLARIAGGAVRSWGYNGYGQLGDGSTTTRPTPVSVSGLSGVTAFAAGSGHSVALTSDGTAWAWGYNGDRELADGTTIDRYTPVRVSWVDAAPPTGSVVINSGATCTTNAAVILTLSATDDSGTVSQVRMSNDGVFDTEPWQAYAGSKNWTLSAGDGTKTVYVRFMDPAGNQSDTVADTIILDTTPPSVNSVIVSPSMGVPGELLHVVVNATDLAGVSSMTAGGVPLTQTPTATWEGDIAATPGLGVKDLAVVALDVLGHSANAAGSYRTASIVCMAGKIRFTDPILASASSRFLFRMWGKVTIVDGNSFDLNAGSATAIRVVAPAYGGIYDSGYASARGILNVSSSPRTLTCKPEHVSPCP